MEGELGTRLSDKIAAMAEVDPGAVEEESRRTLADARAVVDTAVRSFWTYLSLLVRQIQEDKILLTASALAYVTVLSIVPLLATFSFVGAKFSETFEQQTIDFLSGILVFSEQTLLDQIREFVKQAATLQGAAVLFLFLVAIMAFSTIEETLNSIWRVPKGRPLKMRLLTFTLLLFWGPVLIAIGFSGLPILRGLPGMADRAVPLEILSIGAILAVLTALYWIVPFTTVQLRVAVLGAVVGTLGLAGVRWGFTYYVGLAQNLNVIYGSFALAFLFVISIDLAWMIVLLGCEVAYTAQHFKSLERSSHGERGLEGRWAGLATLAVILERFRHGEPVVNHDSLGDELQIPPDDLPTVLDVLVGEGWLRRTREQGHAYVLAIDPHRLSIDEIFSAYDRRCEAVFEPLQTNVAGRLRDLVRALSHDRREGLSRISLADVVDEQAIAFPTPSGLGAESGRTP